MTARGIIYIMKARPSSNYYLEAIPLILDNNNNICLPGQAFNTYNSRLCIYSALSCDGRAWYSDIQDDDPISEYDLYSKGMVDAIIGYNQGLHVINLQTGDITFKPITVEEFITIRKKSSPITLNNKFVSLYDRPTKQKDVYQIYNLREKELGIVYDMQSMLKWYKDFPLCIYLSSLQNSLIGISAGVNKPRELTYIDDIWEDDTIKLPFKSVKWNHKDPWNAFNSEIRKWCYIGN